jgi:hypothetical protein
VTLRALLAATLIAIATPATASALSFVEPLGSPFGPSSEGNEGGPVSFDLADVNGDGKLDAITLNSLGSKQTVSVMLGEGEGRFQAPSAATISPLVRYDNLEQPTDAVVGDFNDDGKLDIVVPYSDRGGETPGSGIGLMLGNGNGSFEPAQPTILLPSVYGAVSGIAAGDLTGNGDLDLVVVLSPNPNITPTATDRIVVLLGNGHGEFTEESPITLRQLEGATTTETFPQSIAIADVNGDGKLDLLVTRGGLAAPHQYDVGVSVLLGDGKGGFTEEQGSPFDTGGQGAGGGIGVDQTHIVTADLTDNGHLDIITVNKQKPSVGNPTGGSVSVLLGDGGGGFAPAPGSPFPDYEAGAVAPNPEPNTVAVGDFEGDGDLDLAVANYREKDVAILRGEGNGNFAYDAAATTAIASNTEAPLYIRSVDLDGNGTPDLAIAEQIENRTRISVLLNTSRPTAEPSTTSLAFGTVTAGQSSAPQKFTIANHGSYPLHVASVEIAGDDYAVEALDCTSAPIPVEGSCEIAVAFTPQAAGVLPSTLAITTDASATPLSIALSGAGYAASKEPESENSFQPPPTQEGQSPGDQLPQDGSSPPAAQTALTFSVHASHSIVTRSGGSLRVTIVVRNPTHTASSAKVCLAHTPRAFRPTPCVQIAKLAAHGHVARALVLHTRPNVRSGQIVKLAFTLSTPQARPRHASLTLHVRRATPKATHTITSNPDIVQE